MESASTNLSTRGKALIERAVALRRSPEFLTYQLMQARSVPPAGQIDAIDVAQLRRLLEQRCASVEQKIDEFVKAIHLTRRENETYVDRSFRVASKTLAIQACENTADVSREPHELDYMARMVAEHRNVILKIAQNPYLAEETQVFIACHPTYNADPCVGRALANNPALGPEAARQLARRFKDDRFVIDALGDTVGKIARVGPNETVYADVCREMTTVPKIDFPHAGAVRGVTDANHLRTLWKQHLNKNVAERNLDIATFHALAQNPDTPDDVIKNMADNSPVGALIGKQGAITQDVFRRRFANIGVSRELDASNHTPQYST